MKKYLLLIIALGCLTHAEHFIKVSNTAEDNIYFDLRSKNAITGEDYRIYEYVKNNHWYAYTHSELIKVSRIRIGDTLCKGEATYKSSEKEKLNLLVTGSEKACVVSSWVTPNFS